MKGCAEGQGMKRLFWVVLGWFVLSFAAHAASFDCSKAGSKLEKFICADAELSRLDEELAEIYKTALQNENQSERIRQTQKQWLKGRDGCQYADCLAQEYIKRIHEVADTLAQEVHYRYQLKESHDKDLCIHMTHVFDQNFRTPWYKGWLKLEPNPVLFGKPYDQVFERLPGVEYSKKYTWNMLLSKYPSSPEFDEVHWREGRVSYVGGASSISRPEPMLVAEIDIDNDGQKEWVVKHSFMDKMTTWEGMGQAYGGSDSLKIFPFDGFDPLAPLTNEQLFYGQKPDRPPRMIDRDVTEKLDTAQLRPFVFKGKVYLSAYQVYWPNLELTKQLGHNAIAKPDKVYPEREYMNILRVTTGGRRILGQVIETANTETVCHIRMIMLTNQTKQKGD